MIRDMPDFASPNNFIVDISLEGFKNTSPSKQAMGINDKQQEEINAPVRFESGQGLFDHTHNSGQPINLNQRSF